MSQKRNWPLGTLGLLIIITLLMTACGQKDPENVLEAVEQAEVIKIAVSADYPPFMYVDESGEFTGYSIDVDRELAERLGVELELIDVPFDTLFTGMLEGKYDVADGAHIWTEEREETMDMPRPYFIDQYALLVAEDFDESQIQTVEDIAKVKVGTLTGGAEELFLTEHLVEPGLLPEENLIFYDRNDSVALDIKAGRIDLTLNKLMVLVAFVDELGGLKIIHIDGLPEEQGVNMAVKEGETELRDAIDNIFADLEDEGFFQQLAEKYGMVD